MAEQIQNIHFYQCSSTRVVASRYKTDFSAGAVVKTQVSARVLCVMLEMRLDVSVLSICDVLSTIRAVGYRCPGPFYSRPWRQEGSGSAAK